MSWRSISTPIPRLRRGRLYLSPIEGDGTYASFSGREFQLTFVSAISIIGYWTFVNLFQDCQTKCRGTPVPDADWQQV